MGRRRTIIVFDLAAPVFVIVIVVVEDRRIGATSR
jgi:hypothetical protein